MSSVVHQSHPGYDGDGFPWSARRCQRCCVGCRRVENAPRVNIQKLSPMNSRSYSVVVEKNVIKSYGHEMPAARHASDE